jgi:branched-chain amino acid transport system substrate-binding protein
MVGVVLGLGTACGGGKPEPFRIGIVADCYGPFSAIYEIVAASAELPLLQRGGTLRGKNPSDGVEGIEVAGRPVELLLGCANSNWEVLPEARRLVEEEGAAVLVGPLDPQQGLVLRAYARRRPETIFLVQPSDAPELTLSDSAPNVFRFLPDAAQWTAGLGSYAYRKLGWRTAVTIGDDIPYGYETVSGFVAEFCALGGRVLERRWVPVGVDPAVLVPDVHRAADGVFMGTALAPTRNFLLRYSALHLDLPRRLVASGVLLTDPSVLPLARGIVVGGLPPLEPGSAATRYTAAFAKAFPRIPAAAALDSLASAYRDGVEAALEALERAEGSGGQSLRNALAGIELESPSGRIRLDRRRQAVAPNYLSRVVIAAGGRPTIRTVRMVPNVEQTFGGYFEPGDPPPSRTSTDCKHGTPPPWAR